MVKLTKSQREMLEWLSTTDLEVPSPVVADRLVVMGYAVCMHDCQRGEDFYRITEAGRAALTKEGK